MPRGSAPTQMDSRKGLRAPALPSMNGKNISVPAIILPQRKRQMAKAGYPKMSQKSIILGKEAIDFLSAYGIPVIKTTPLTRKDLPALSPPLVLKAVSPKIIHKAKHKAVEIAYTKSAILSAYSRLSRLGGVIAQPYSPGFELIMGIKRDELFGHVLLFGTGGTHVEAINDVAFRSVPITRKDALELVRDTRAYRLLAHGGRRPDLSVLRDALMKLNRMALENPGIDELDINPFILDGEKGWAVDARIVMAGEVKGRGEGGSGGKGE